MKKILIAGKEEKCKNYVNAVNNLNCEAVVQLDVENIEDYYGLILPGGGDIDPSFFGQENNGSKSIDIELDKKQFEIVKKFYDAKKPILGICRGMQIINVYFGGDMIQDLPNSEKHSSEDGEKFHEIISVEDCFLEKEYGKIFTVNTSHHQACDKIAKGFMEIARSADGVTEGILHKELPILGVQWHPELISFEKKKEKVSDGASIFKYFVNQ